MPCYAATAHLRTTPHLRTTCGLATLTARARPASPLFGLVSLAQVDLVRVHGRVGVDEELGSDGERLCLPPAWREQRSRLHPAARVVSRRRQVSGDRALRLRAQAARLRGQRQARLRVAAQGRGGGRGALPVLAREAQLVARRCLPVPRQRLDGGVHACACGRVHAGAWCACACVWTPTDGWRCACVRTAWHARRAARCGHSAPPLASHLACGPTRRARLARLGPTPPRGLDARSAPPPSTPSTSRRARRARGKSTTARAGCAPRRYEPSRRARPPRTTASTSRGPTTSRCACASLARSTPVGHLGRARTPPYPRPSRLPSLAVSPSKFGRPTTPMPRAAAQHTHGVYVRTSLKCDGKPVYMQQTGSATSSMLGDARLGNSRARGLAGRPGGTSLAVDRSGHAALDYDSSQSDCEPTRASHSAAIAPRPPPTCPPPRARRPLAGTCAPAHPRVISPPPRSGRSAALPLLPIWP